MVQTHFVRKLQLLAGHLLLDRLGPAFIERLAVQNSLGAPLSFLEVDLRSVELARLGRRGLDLPRDEVDYVNFLLHAGRGVSDLGPAQGDLRRARDRFQGLFGGASDGRCVVYLVHGVSANRLLFHRRRAFFFGTQSLARAPLQGEHFLFQRFKLFEQRADLVFVFLL